MIRPIQSHHFLRAIRVERWIPISLFQGLNFHDSKEKPPSSQPKEHKLLIKLAWFCQNTFLLSHWKAEPFRSKVFIWNAPDTETVCFFVAHIRTSQGSIPVAEIGIWNAVNFKGKKMLVTSYPVNILKREEGEDNPEEFSVKYRRAQVQGLPTKSHS